MDPTTFDTLARSIAQTGTRRWLLARLAAVPLVGVLAVGGAEDVGAERPQERLQQRTQQRNRKQRNRRRRNKNQNQNNNQNNGGGDGGRRGAPGPCLATGKPCTQSSQCCSSNCFNFVCAATVSQCTAGGAHIACSPLGTGCCANDVDCCAGPDNQCNGAGLCCAPNCAGRQCGPDGCGGAGTCGTCPPNSSCRPDGTCCANHLGPCTSPSQCCSTDHTACAVNNVVINQNVCCTTLGGTCATGGPSGDCCTVVVPQGLEYANCSPSGTCGGQGAVCRANEACVSGQCNIPGGADFGTCA